MAGQGGLPLPAARAQTAEVQAVDAPATLVEGGAALAAPPPPAEAAPLEPVPTETAPADVAPTETAPTEGTPAAAVAPTEGAPAAPAEGVAEGEAPTEAPSGPPPVPGLEEEAVPPEAPEGEAAPQPPEPPRAPVDWSIVANPVPADAASVERGRLFYLGQGLCAVCHGDKGDGFGPVREQFSPPPNAFLDTKWQQSFTDGQIMGLLHEGKFGTGMLAMVPDFMTEAEGWDVINYLRTFSGKTSEAYERDLKERAQREAERQKRIQGEIP